MAETCSLLTYYFYKVVFLTIVNLLLFTKYLSFHSPPNATSHDIWGSLKEQLKLPSF